MKSRIERHALRGTVIAIAAAVSIGFTGPVAQAQEARDYLLATASTGGTYYPVGVALATLAKVKLQPKQKINVSAINSAGSGENVKLLRDNEVQFAILQGLFGYYAQSGTGPVAADGPQEHLRSISMLWSNVEHFIVKAEYAETGTVSDFLKLQGEKVSMGRQTSGTIGSNRVLMKNLGVDMDTSYDLAFMGYTPSAEALQNGNIDGMSTPAGPPVGAVTQAMAALGDKIKLLDFTDEQLAQADGGLGLWTRFVIPANTYPGQDKDVNTIAQPNFLAVRDDVDEEAVYLITKTIFENLPFLQAIHGATKAMSLDRALAGLPVPLHPGAVRYYKEAGITVPDSLMAQ
ncbi:MAG: TAXI family TRAP transporter solute-binding subunit [Alphaproteobacteria bacterium]